MVVLTWWLRSRQRVSLNQRVTDPLQKFKLSWLKRDLRWSVVAFQCGSLTGPHRARSCCTGRMNLPTRFAGDFQLRRLCLQAESRR